MKKNIINYKIKFILYFITYIFYSCSNSTDEIKKAYIIAGDNASELRVVSKIFKGDKEKIRAYQFLLNGMINKYFYNDSTICNYDGIFDTIEYLYNKDLDITKNEKMLNIYFNSLINNYGNINPVSLSFVPDLQYVSSQYIIKVINEAYKCKEKYSWLKKVNDNIFFEYLLSYKYINDKPEYYWEIIDTFRKNHLRKLDTSQSVVDICIDLNNELKDNFEYLGIFKNYPVPISLNNMIKGRTGECRDLTNFACYYMKTYGIPVSVDFVDQWADRAGKHYWNAIVLSDSSSLPFMGAQRNPGDYAVPGLPGKGAKYFRKTFSIHDSYLSHIKSYFPSYLLKKNAVDVTDQYTKTFDIKVKFNCSDDLEPKIVFLAVFDNSSWFPIAYSKLSKMKYGLFEKMATNIIYCPVYYDEYTLKYGGPPFLLDSLGRVKRIIPSGNNDQNLFLKRKYPIMTYMYEYIDEMIGGQIQGSNNKDFNEYAILYTINHRPHVYLQSDIINNPKKYKYYRYLSSPQSNSRISELGFFFINENNDTFKLQGKIISSNNYEEKHPPSDAFDGNCETFSKSVDKKKGGWIGLELKYPQQLNLVRYQPMTYNNIVNNGDEYELFYWFENQWISLGKKVAKGNSLEYFKCPENALFILKDLSRGKQERIFLYENQKQIFY